jgi:hypothetical protein
MGHRCNLLNLDVILKWLYNHVLNQHREQFSILQLPVVTAGGKIVKAINQHAKDTYLYGVFYCRLARFFPYKMSILPTIVW